MACRVTCVPSLRRTMESGPSAPNRDTSWSRVSSPRAANSGAASLISSAALLLRDIALDVLQLRAPAALVAAERFRAAPERDAVEARLDDGELSSGRARLELEFNECH